jgi:hypothetical protein
MTLLLIICVDLKSLYNCLIKLGIIQEKRLIINIICLCQLYKQRKIIKVKWINSNSNPANTITKNKAFTALRQLININYIHL